MVYAFCLNGPRASRQEKEETVFPFPDDARRTTKDATGALLFRRPFATKASTKFDLCRQSGTATAYVIGFDRSAFAAKPAMILEQARQINFRIG
jgi:hypothetical protein